MYILYQQGAYDSNPETLDKFKTIDDIMKWIEKESNDCYKIDPKYTIPYSEYKKDVEFVSWDFAYKTITKKTHSCVYKLKRFFEKDDEYVNGEWEYIPLMGIYEPGHHGILNRWIEIDYYCDKLLI